MMRDFLRIPSEFLFIAIYGCLLMGFWGYRRFVKSSQGERPVI